MKIFENRLNNLGVIIQKHEEVFNLVIENQKKKHKILPDEVFITLMLFRKIVERLDAIFILIENKSENAAKSICRDLFENFLYFSYVVESNDKNKIRALSYYYSTLNDQIKLSKLLMSKNQRGKKIRDFLNIKSDNVKLKEKTNRAATYFSNSTNGDAYANIKIEWDRLIKNKVNYPNWYSLYKGPKSLRELSLQCGYEVEYDLLYGIYSRQVHSSNVMDQFENVNGLAGIKSLRRYEDPTLELIFSFSLGIESLRKLVDFFEINDEIKIGNWIKDEIK
ncbi:DUF5677 domain-containing protein [Sporosarcina sp. Te-1]|uniref:DUF5677 domain-containing protein n=1 Tax=Sporosarcina sp. Te-1 TaxID=2818390 RepID=UPI001A9FA50E|nr:DUF5677 domain-containing protein [Sporosarcina sp. Te-1]QTD40613.1 hypothetical protein J3U78_17895 [Sporosarcina sp. Te-1]